MVFAYLTLVFIFLGVCLWGAAAFVESRGRRLKAARRRQYQNIGRYLGIAAKISLLLCALSFVAAYIMTQGAQG